MTPIGFTEINYFLIHTQKTEAYLIKHYIVSYTKLPLVGNLKFDPMHLKIFLLELFCNF